MLWNENGRYSGYHMSQIIIVFLSKSADSN